MYLRAIKRRSDSINKEDKGDMACDNYHETLKQKLANKRALAEEDYKYLVNFLSGDIPKHVFDNTIKHKVMIYASQMDGDGKRPPKITADVSTQTESLSDNKSAIDFLKCQAQLKTGRDEEGIDRAMSETFESRRHFIQFEGPTIRGVQDSCPFLFERKQLLAEFARITGTDIVDVFYQKLKMHSRAILDSSQPSCAATKAYKKSKECAETEEQVQYVTLGGALLALPYLLRESISHIIEFRSKRPKTTYPIIICESNMENSLSGEPSFSVYAENIQLCRNNDLIEAVLLYMAAYYIFDISYPDSIFQTATLIEMLLLDLQSESESVPKAVTEIHKLLLLFAK